MNCPLKTEKVIIQEGVHIGIGAIIMPGVMIGKVAIIGTGSFIKKDIPAYCVSTGIPAKVLKELE